MVTRRGMIGVDKPMRLVSGVTLCLAVLSACEPDSRVVRYGLYWMDWPAEVRSGVQFNVRMVLIDPCGGWAVFQPDPSASQSAITFEPYFLGVRDDVLCAAALRVGGLDTVVTAPRLAPAIAQTFEMRGAVWPELGGSQLPIRTFGEFVVQPSSPAEGRRNGAGWVYAFSDTLGCRRIRPVGAYRPGTDLPLEDQADTAGLNGSFVRGYLYDASTPVCGETRVFHLLSKGE